jgi:hypothetical protein
MVFSLEALRALHGDSLLLHYGTPADPKTVLIDGGPNAVYGQTLKPRLRELRDHLIGLGKISATEPLPLALTMVSHIDDDHIGGLIALTNDADGGLGIPHPCWVMPKTLWHNTFEEVAGGEVVAPVGELPHEDSKTAAVIASVGQGKKLRAAAETLGWEVNRPFQGLVKAPETGGQNVKLDADTAIVVLGPRADEIEGLRKEWAEQVKKHKKGEASPAEIAAYEDKSPYNLSSIVCLVVQGEHKMLLTGDARGDHILTSLDAAGVTTNGALHVDILKIPHHGSIRDVEKDFFERITADHYVISASGRYGNPETETLDLIADSRPKADEFTIHLTYAALEKDLGERLKKFVAERAAAGHKFAVSTRSDPALSLAIDLGEPPFG